MCVQVLLNAGSRKTVCPIEYHLYSTFITILVFVSNKVEIEEVAYHKTEFRRRTAEQRFNCFIRDVVKLVIYINFFNQNKYFF